MATQTTNLGLIKPAGTDYVLVSDFNSNADTLDGAIGDLTALETTEKTSLVGAVNDVLNSASATVNVGTTTTGNPGTSASVTNSGTTKDAVFNFTIPRGDPGVSVTVGTTTTGAAGSSASVSNSGTASDPILDFTVPQGANGVGVPTGGAIGQALVKSSATDYATEWVAVGSTNPNLLINWDWRYMPVNQRGLSGAISSGYVYDMVKRSAGTITISSGYLSIPANAAVIMPIEGNGLAGKTVCVSVMIGNTVYSGTGAFPTSAGTTSVTITGFGTATLTYASGYMAVTFTADESTRNVQAVKLELGTVSTLANDAPANYGEQCAKCQRYLIPLSSVSVYVGSHYSGNATVLGFIPTPCTMRVTPTFVCSAYGLLYLPTTLLLVTGVNSYALANNGVVVTVSADGLSGMGHFTSCWDPGANCYLSAELI